MQKITLYRGETVRLTNGARVVNRAPKPLKLPKVVVDAKLSQREAKSNAY